MKTFIKSALLVLIIGNIGAADIESYQFIDYLRAISVPSKPLLFEDGVIFTASSSYHRVGISFAHEGYGKVHWFKRLVVPGDPAELIKTAKNPKKIDPNIDSGILFHFEAIPGNLKNLDYRMIIDGLWTTDPLNPTTVQGPAGVLESRVPLPSVTGPEKAKALADAPGTYRFSFRAAPDEIVSVGGSFNNWDPFMYELREISPGFYALSLPLPPGRFQYAFYYRGEIIPDPANPRSLYSREGRIVSEALVP